MKTVLFLALFVAVRADVPPPGLLDCPPLEQILQHKVIQSLGVHRYFYRLVNLLAHNCVNLDVVVRKNNELGRIVGANNQEPVLAKHLDALLAVYDEANDFEQTQVASIAQGLKLLQISEYYDINNNALEKVYNLTKDVVNYASQKNKNINGLFKKHLDDLKKILELRKFVIQEPFRGLVLNTETVEIIRHLLAQDDPVVPAKVMAGLRYAMKSVLPLIQDTFHYSNLTTEIIFQLGEALRQVKDQSIKDQIYELFYLLNKNFEAQNYNGVISAPTSAENILKFLRKANLAKALVSPLESQKVFLEFIASHQHHPGKKPNGFLKNQKNDFLKNGFLKNYFLKNGFLKNGFLKNDGDDFLKNKNDFLKNDAPSSQESSESQSPQSSGSQEDDFLKNKDDFLKNKNGFLKNEKNDFLKNKNDFLKNDAPASQESSESQSQQSSVSQEDNFLKNKNGFLKNKDDFLKNKNGFLKNEKNDFLKNQAATTGAPASDESSDSQSQQSSESAQSDEE